LKDFKKLKTLLKKGIKQRLKVLKKVSVLMKLFQSEYKETEVHSRKDAQETAK
jgi:hypothetical protein